MLIETLNSMPRSLLAGGDAKDHLRVVFHSATLSTIEQLDFLFTVLPET